MSIELKKKILNILTIIVVIIFSVVLSIKMEHIKDNGLNSFKKVNTICKIQDKKEETDNLGRFKGYIYCMDESNSKLYMIVIKTTYENKKYTVGKSYKFNLIKIRQNTGEVTYRIINKDIFDIKPVE